jgi:hypothetical protein
MRFTLVSTKDPNTKRQIEVPDAIVVNKFAAGCKKKPTKNDCKKKSIKKNPSKKKSSKASFINKKVQKTNPIIRKHGSV